MEKTSPLNDDERAELVAYLDGELDETTAAALEAKLHLNAKARTEAEQLRRTWELLDYLPKPQPSGDFTHRTMERIVAETQSAAFRQRLLARGWPLLKGLTWAAAALLAALVGFGSGRLVPHHSPPTQAAEVAGEIDADWVRDLRVIQNRRLFEHVGNVQFLKKLADPEDPDLFGDDNADS
jgi:anti-sigma factor RsiW